MALDRKLEKEHIARLGDHAGAVKLYREICKLVADRPDGIDAASQRLVYSCASLEILKEMAMDDILENGTREQYRNGNQRGERENRNVSIFQRSIEGQRKLLSELQLTPASRKTAVQTSFLDGFGEF